jgi:hypothetical protein
VSAAFAPSPWLAWVKAKRTTSQTARGSSPGRPPRNANTRAWGKAAATATSFAVGGGHRLEGPAPASDQRHWRHQGDQKPKRSLTMIAVTLSAVITLLMMRMLLTPAAHSVDSPGAGVLERLEAARSIHRCAASQPRGLSRSRRGLFLALTRGDDGGSKQTRTADPLLVRQRQYVRRNSRLYVPASQNGIHSSAHPCGLPRTALRGYIFGYIPRAPKGGQTKIN